MAQFNFFTFFDRGVEIHVRDRSVVGSKPVNGFCNPECKKIIHCFY